MNDSAILCLDLVDKITSVRAKIKTYADGMADAEFPYKNDQYGGAPSDKLYVHARNERKRLEEKLARLEKEYDAAAAIVRGRG